MAAPDGAAPIRLLCLDVDGTLVDPAKQLTPAARAAVARAAAAGLTVAIASGRHPFNVCELLDDLGLPHTAVCLSGSLALLDGREVFRHALGAVATDQAVRAAADCGCYLSLAGADFNLTAGSINRGPGGMSPAMRRYHVCESYDEMLSVASEHADEILKASIHAETDEAYARLRERLALIEGVEVANSDVHWVDVNASGCTKAEGIEALADALGISMAQVAAVGDDENDVASIAAAGLGIAMGNAIPEVLAVANATVADNAHDGVVEAIDLALARA